MIDPQALFAAVIGVLLLGVGFDLGIAFIMRTEKEASGRDNG